MGYFDTLLRYFEVWGRTSRRQYWTYQLVMIAAIVAAVFADVGAIRSGLEHTHIGLIVTFVTIIHCVPSITATVRRLHDIGRSGWWYLLCFVPLGGLVVLYWTFVRGDTGDNAYGPPPDEGGAMVDDGFGYMPPAGRVVRMGSAAPRAATADFDPNAVPTNRFI
jgi:uncharacterized membrane protein YhaH (DUF805 family)